MQKTQQKSIIHIIDTTGPGGAETIFLNLAENLQIDGYHNIAVIRGPGWVEKQLQKKNIEYIITKPHGFFSISYYFKLIRIFKKKRVALVQSHLPGSTLTCSIVCFLTRIPLVATIHGQVDINPREQFAFIKQLLIVTGVNALIAVSRNLAEYIHQRRFFHRKKIDVVYNGIDTNRYYRSLKEELKTTLNLKSSTILVGCLGNVRPAKNYELLIEVASIIKQIRGDEAVHFVIAGHQQPDLMKKLDDLATKRNVMTLVHFLGFIDDTPKFLSELELFLLCSSSEGFSIATIEAMAAGIPVIATRCGGPEEIITNNINGILTENNNPNQLAEAICGLIDDKHKKDTLSNAAKEHVLTTFSMTAMVERYHTIYNRFLITTPQP